MIFEIFVIVATIIVISIIRKSDKEIIKKFLITVIAVLLFEFTTSALFINQNLEFWAFLYKGVSWVITIGWASIILASIAIINYMFPKFPEKKRFIIQLVFISIVGIFAEFLVRILEIREYSSLAQKSFSGIMLGGLVPIEALYYIPVFMALVISFKRYWEISYNKISNKGTRK